MYFIAYEYLIEAILICIEFILYLQILLFYFNWTKKLLQS